MDHTQRRRFEQVNVLLVDDNEHTLNLLTQMLRSFGVRLIAKAHDGASAFSVMRHRAFDIIICDWNMKPVDGLKFVRHVRRSADSPDPFVPVIMLTGHTEEERVLEARDAGCNAFLAKPISPATLLSRLKAVLDKPKNFIKTEEYFGPERRRDGDRRDAAERRRRPPEEMPADAAEARPETPVSPLTDSSDETDTTNDA